MLVVAMMLSTCIGTASASNVSEKEMERASLHASIEQQLIDQDALYLMDHFDNLIDEMLAAKYDGISPHAAVQVYAPNGGWMKGYGTYVEVKGVFFNKSQTQTLYNNRNNSNPVADAIIELVCNCTGNYGELLGIVIELNHFSTESQWRDVMARGQGCYFYYVFDTMELRETCIIIPWTPPYMSLSSTITVTSYATA